MCRSSLTSDPWQSKGREVCPGNLQLHCQARNIGNPAVVRWFLLNNTAEIDYTAYSLQDTMFNDLPKVIETLISIPAVVQITLTSVIVSDVDGSTLTGYDSTLTVNTSACQSNEVLAFRCGSFAEKSDQVSLNFTVKCEYFK